MNNTLVDRWRSSIGGLDVALARRKRGDSGLGPAEFDRAIEDAGGVDLETVNCHRELIGTRGNLFLARAPLRSAGGSYEAVFGLDRGRGPRIVLVLPTREEV